MSISFDQAKLAYQLILGRDATNGEINHAISKHNDLAALRRTFLNSEEFFRKHGQLRDERAQLLTETLIHIHVPKTAGTSLSNALRKNSKLQPCQNVHDGADLEALLSGPRTRRDSLRYIYGHLRMVVGDALDMPYRYLIVLRDPGRRIFSFFQFIARTISHPTHGHLTAKRMNFGAFLEFSKDRESHRLELDNGQIRCLSGRFSKHDLGNEPDLLRIALHEILEPSVILGVVEHMDNLLARLAKLDFLPTAELPALNVSPNSDAYADAVQALTPKQQEIFDGYTKYDARLYAAAVENMDVLRGV